MVRVQEAAINVFSTIKKYMNDETMTKLLLPKAKSLFTKSSAVRVRKPNTHGLVEYALTSVGCYYDAS